jgi:hypothetical protein
VIFAHLCMGVADDGAWESGMQWSVGGGNEKGRRRLVGGRRQVYRGPGGASQRVTQEETWGKSSAKWLLDCVI